MDFLSTVLTLKLQSPALFGSEQKHDGTLGGIVSYTKTEKQLAQNTSFPTAQSPVCFGKIIWKESEKLIL